MSRAIILRADGSSQFGMGHVFRCLSLAQGLQDKGHEAVFAVKESTPEVLDKIRQQGFKVVVVQDAASLIETARMHKSTTVIVDLNHAATFADEQGFENYLKALKNAGLYIVMIDGLAQECISTRRALPVDTVLIPYVGAQEGVYKNILKTSLLLGPGYFPFQKNFLRMAVVGKIIVKKAYRLLVSMGGGDVVHLNEKVLEAILSLDIPQLELKVTGSIESEELREKFKNSKGRFQLFPHSDQMPELIHWADLAVIGSGLTKYETSLLGTPAIALSLNEAQQDIMKTFEKAGSVIHLGNINKVTKENIADVISRFIEDEHLRKNMSLKGKALVDGHGFERIMDQIPLEVSS